jgi:hypothetical protein
MGSSGAKDKVKEGEVKAKAGVESNAQKETAKASEVKETASDVKETVRMAVKAGDTKEKAGMVDSDVRDKVLKAHQVKEKARMALAEEELLRALNGAASEAAKEGTARLGLPFVVHPYAITDRSHRALRSVFVRVHDKPIPRDKRVPPFATFWPISDFDLNPGELYADLRPRYGTLRIWSSSILTSPLFLYRESWPWASQLWQEAESLLRKESAAALAQQAQSRSQKHQSAATMAQAETSLSAFDFQSLTPEGRFSRITWRAAKLAGLQSGASGLCVLHLDIKWPLQVPAPLRPKEEDE